MSYQTYITPALICGSFDSNTADKSYLLFTKTAGMLYAAARSVREERSRQRFALQDFSLITVSLIKGKTGWRIGSVQSEGNIFSDAASRQVRGSIVKLIKFLRRFIGGEEPQTALYEEVVEALEYLTNDTLIERALIEELIQARILYKLGYIADIESLNGVLIMPFGDIKKTVFAESLLLQLKAITATATKASHL